MSRVEAVLVFEKPSSKQALMPENMLYDYYGVSFLLEYSTLYLHKDSGIYYMHGRACNSLKDILFQDGPEKGMVVGDLFQDINSVCGYCWSELVRRNAHHDTDFIFMHPVLSQPQLDDLLKYLCFDMVAKMMYYTHSAGLDRNRCYLNFYSHTEPVRSVDRSILLQDAWNAVKDYEPEPIDRLEHLQRLSGMSVRKFANLFNISVRTMENWIYKKRYPSWVPDLLETKMLHDGVI